MSRYVRQIVTRGYETDARMHASIGMVARYFEHVRWEAIRDRDAGVGRVFANGGKMVIRAQAVRVLRPIVAREEIELQLSIARVGTSSIHFVHFARCGDVVVARNDAIGVALDAAGKPTQVADEVRARATGEAVDPPAKIPPAPETPLFRCPVQVRYNDLDALKHVNHSRYIDYVDECFQHARAAGVYARAFSHDPASVAVEYERETRIEGAGPDRKLEVTTWQVNDEALGFELIDPMDGVRVARAMIRPA